MSFPAGMNARADKRNHVEIPDLDAGYVPLSRRINIKWIYKESGHRELIPLAEFRTWIIFVISMNIVKRREMDLFKKQKLGEMDMVHSHGKQDS